MPTYEYECAKCGGKFDVFQKMSDKPAAKCPKCGGKGQRLISSGSGVIFKGSGFYETDYKRKSNPFDSAQDLSRAKSRDKKETKSDPSCPSAKSDSCKSCPMHKEGG